MEDVRLLVAKQRLSAADLGRIGRVDRRTVRHRRPGQGGFGLEHALQRTSDQIRNACPEPQPMNALLTDLYELNMVASYLRRGMNGMATFSLFVRRLPEQRGFLVSAGAVGGLDYLAHHRVRD